MAFWPIESSSRHSQLYFELKILGFGPKLSPLRDLRATVVTFSRPKITLFLMKKALQKPPIWKKFAFWPIRSSSRHSQLYFEAPTGLRSDQSHIFEAQNKKQERPVFSLRRVCFLKEPFYFGSIKKSRFLGKRKLKNPI